MQVMAQQGDGSDVGAHAPIQVIPVGKEVPSGEETSSTEVTTALQTVAESAALPVKAHVGAVTRLDAAEDRRNALEARLGAIKAFHLPGRLLASAFVLSIFIALATLLGRELLPYWDIGMRAKTLPEAVGVLGNERSEETPPPGPLLLVAKPVVRTNDDSFPLGVTVFGLQPGMAIEINGLPTGMTISAGRALGVGRWRIPATEVAAAMIRPAPGFKGATNLSIELRLGDDTIVDTAPLHWEGARRPVAMATPAEPSQGAAPANGLVDRSTSASVGNLIHDVPAVREAPALRGATAGRETTVVRETALVPEASPIRETRAASLSPEQIDFLIKRSELLISQGDIASARILLQRAAEAHDERAALALGATYDPIMLTLQKAYGVDADTTLARMWYGKARDYGSKDAQQRLELLTNNTTSRSSSAP